MTISPLRKLFVSSMAAVALFAGSTLFFTESAAAQVVAPQANVEEAPARTNFRGRRGGNGIGREVTSQAVADALGISVEELQAAREDGIHWTDIAADLGISEDTVHAAIYDAAVVAINDAIDSGDLTAEQGASALERAELQYLSSIVIDKDVLEQAKADALGLTVAEMEAAKEAGTSFSELAEANGTTTEAVRAAVTAAKQAMVDQAIADGILTAEQGEQIMEGGNRGGQRGGGRRGNGPRGPQVDTPDNA